MTQASQVYLGLDYGTVRVGVARNYGQLAEPLVVLPNDDSIWSRLQELIDLHRVSLVVVGMSEQQTAARTAEFIAQLQQRLTVPIVSSDETLTTQEARRRLAQTKSGRRALSGPVDHYAAAAILEEWLETKGANS